MEVASAAAAAAGVVVVDMDMEIVVVVVVVVVVVMVMVVVDVLQARVAATAQFVPSRNPRAYKSSASSTSFNSTSR